MQNSRKPPRAASIRGEAQRSERVEATSYARMLFLSSLKKCLTAIAHGFKCGPEVISNLGTNLNEGGNE